MTPGLEKSEMVQPLSGGLQKGKEAALAPGEEVIVSLAGSIGEALVLTEQRALIIKSGLLAGAPFGPKVFSFPYGEIDDIQLAGGG